MENLSSDEISKLELGKKLFKVDSLTKEQIELILGRPIEPPPPKPIIKRKVKKLREPDIELSIFRDEERRVARKLKKEHPVDCNIPNIYRESHSDCKPYRIERTRFYKYSKYQTVRSEWKIFGPVDIFQVNDVIVELVNKMTANLPDNAKLQVSLVSSDNNTVNQTRLLNKKDMVDKLAEWVHFFIDYSDMDISDITFKLLTIELPTAAGGSVNRIIDASSKRSIIQVKNYDTICLA